MMSRSRIRLPQRVVALSSDKPPSRLHNHGCPEEEEVKVQDPQSAGFGLEAVRTLPEHL